MAEATRRGIFGLGAGVVVAAPSIATSASGAFGEPPYGSAMFGSGVKAGQSEFEYMTEQLRRLTKRRKELLSRESDTDYNVCLPDTMVEIEALRSVSPVHRYAMVRERYQRQQAARELRNIDRAISEIVGIDVRLSAFVKSLG